MSFLTPGIRQENGGSHGCHEKERRLVATGAETRYPKWKLKQKILG